MFLKPSERRDILFQVSISPPKTYWIQSSLPVCSFSIPLLEPLCSHPPPASVKTHVPGWNRKETYLDQQRGIMPCWLSTGIPACQPSMEILEVTWSIHLWHSSSNWIASHRCMSGHMYISCWRYYSGEHQYNIRQHAIHSKHSTLWLNMKWQFEIEISLGVFTQKSLDSGVSYSFFKWCCFLIIMVY